MRLKKFFRFRRASASGRSAVGPSIKISGAQGVLYGDNSHQTNNWYSIVVSFAERVRTYVTGPDRTHGQAWLAGEPSGGGASGVIRIERNIVLWGAPGSGKTTYLAALGTALSSAVPSWTLRCTDSASRMKITGLQQELLTRGRFPAHTAEPAALGVDIAGPVQGSTPLLSRTPAQRAVRISLSILDPPGEMFGPDSRYPADEMVDELARARGFLFFFDPILEQERGGSYEHFLTMIAGLMQMTGGPSPGSEDARLPHRIAVCITKLDDPFVYAAASSLNILKSDQNGMPTVPDNLSEEFFETLCRTTGGGRAMYLRKAIQQHFHESRTRYFTISSVGFYPDKSLHFNPDDFINVIKMDTDELMLRSGYIIPVNLVAPLIWLSASDHRGAPDRRKPHDARLALPASRSAALPALPDPSARVRREG
jgi:hypothetical protein